MRFCKNCEDPYCLECYLQEHSTPSTRAHMFRVLKKATPKPFDCSKCRQELATYATLDFKSCYCDACYEQWADYDTELLQNGAVHFKAGSPSLASFVRPSAPVPFDEITCTRCCGAQRNNNKCKVS